MAAPGTLEGMLDFARDKLDIVAPAGDLLYQNAYDVLMQDVTAAFVVGQSVVEGVRCETTWRFGTPVSTGSSGSRRARSRFPGSW